MIRNDNTRRVLHRDLKPENFVMDGRGYIMLTVRAQIKTVMIDLPGLTQFAELFFIVIDLFRILDCRTASRTSKRCAPIHRVLSDTWLRTCETNRACAFRLWRCCSLWFVFREMYEEGHGHGFPADYFALVSCMLADSLARTHDLIFSCWQTRASACTSLC
jgi:hypothetical protein